MTFRKSLILKIGVGDMVDLIEDTVPLARVPNKGMYEDRQQSHRYRKDDIPYIFC